MFLPMCVANVKICDIKYETLAELWDRQTVEQLDPTACGQHVLLRHRYVSLAVYCTAHLDTVVGVQ